MNRKFKSLIAMALLVFMLLPSVLTVFAYDKTTAEQQPGAGAYKHVAIIGLDGAGAFFKDTDTPNIDRIFENGAITYTAQTSIPSISAQSWGSLLHGVTPEFHRLTNSIAGSSAFDNDSEYPSIFRVARENDPTAVLGSFCHWKAINVGIVENGFGVTKFNGSTDANVTQSAADYVKESSPTLLFVQFDDVDVAGHNYGYGSQESLDAITRLDGYVGDIYQAYVDKGIIDDTLFIVTADHGGTYTVGSDGTVSGSHGGLTDEEMNIMIAITGKTVVKGQIGEAEIRDIAAIVTYALGYDNPESWSARVPSGIFEGVVAGERPVYVSKSLNRKHLTIPTPIKGERGYYENFINKKDLIAYLPLDGTPNDLLGNATASEGKLYYSDAYFGQGTAFDDGHISLDATVSGTDDFAVAFWMNTTGVTGDPAIISNQNWASRANLGFTICMQGDKLIFSMGNGKYGTKNYFTLPEDYKDGWVHVVFSIDRVANTVTATIDFKWTYTQELLANYSSGTYSGSMEGQDTTSPYSINIGQDGTGKFNYPFSGALDDVMIFNRSLDAEYVSNLYDYYYCNLTPEEGDSGYITNFITDKPLVNYLNFDGDINDTCGNTTRKHNTITYDSGYYGKAAVLDRGYISIPDYDPGTDSFTIAFYVNTKKLTGVGDPAIVSNKDWGSGANPGWVFAIAENDQGVDRWVFNAKGEADGAKYTKYIPIDTDIDNKWTHVTLSFDRETNTATFYLNFVKIATWTNFPSHSLTSKYPLNIGNDGTGNYGKFKGMIDEFMIFGDALTDSDIANLERYFDKSDSYEVSVAPTPEIGDAGYISNYVDNGIINYLPFDDSVADVTGSSTTANGTVTYTQGYFGKAVTLDKGYVSILDHDPGTESFTVSFWLRTDGLHTGKYSDPVIYGNGNWNASKTPGHLFYYQDDALGFNVGSGDGVNRQKQTTPADCTGQWKHCLVVYDRELGQMRIIYDFDTKNSYSFNYTSKVKDVTFTSTYPLNIGDDGTGTYDGSLLMDIDEFIIFKGALDSNDIANLADYYGKLNCNIDYTDREYTPTPDEITDTYVNNLFTDKKLQAYLPFDGNSLNAAGSLTATINGTPIVDDGYYGSALNFVNKGTYAKVTDFAPGKNNFTIATWVKVGSGNADPVIFANKNWVGLNSGFLVYVKYHSSGDIEIKFNMGNGSYRLDKVLCKLPSDYQERWMHIAVSMDRDAKKLLLFVNFEQVVSHDLEAEFDNLEFNTPLVIGQQSDGNLWVKTNAYIDEFMIFGDALNAADITKLSGYYADTEHNVDETVFEYNENAHWNVCADCGKKCNIDIHAPIENSAVCECGYVLEHQHAYDNEYDPDCNICGEVREVEIPVTEIAKGTCGVNTTWVLTSDGVLTISGEGDTEDYLVSITTEQPYRAYADKITKVVIEDGVTSIGRGAFYGFTAITEVVLPESLIAIHEYAFFGCSGIKTIDIPANTFYIGMYAFRKSGLTEMTFTNAEGWTFADGTALDVTNVKAFTTENTYKQTCMRPVYEDGEIIANGVFGNKEQFTWTLTSTGVLTVSGNGAMPKFNVNTTPWYGYRGAIRSVVIEEGITSVGRCAFHTCRAITSVTLPESLETIAEYAFYNCQFLTEATIPANVTRIEIYAFRKCYQLKDVTFAINYGWSAGDAKVSATELNSNAADMLTLVNYTKIWTRDINAEEEVLDPNYVTGGACNTTVKWSLTYTDDTKTKMKLTISGTGAMPKFETAGTPWYGYLNDIVEVEVCEGITEIGRCSFYGLKFVKTATIADTVTSINDYAFSGCFSLKTIEIPASVTYIAETAFTKTGLSEIPTV